MTDADVKSLSGQLASPATPFWRFSLAFYRRPGVADACIALQEEAGVDVNLLLFLLWHATLKRAVSRDEVQALELRVAPWREAAVVPLRCVRRMLKSPPALVPASTAEFFRTKIKAVELEAERLQQEAMHELVHASLLGHDVPSKEEAARTNVANYASIAQGSFPRPAVERLFAAFAALGRDREQPEE